MSDVFPVYVDSEKGRVQVGTARRDGEGFLLQLGDLRVASTPVAASRGPAASSGEVFPNYGRSKGAPIRGASMQDLEYYANGAKRSLGDASKARFHDKERALLAAIEAEMARQQGEGGVAAPSGGEEPPFPTDEDAPF